MDAILALENGKFFKCRSFTGTGEVGGEIVFNTSMTGYQEILTDPSYFGQIITMTYPMIGNYGINFFDLESDCIYPSAFLIREYQENPSNFRLRTNLANYLNSYGVIGIEGLDTRSLTKYIRNFGSMRAFVSTLDLNPYSLVNKAKSMPIITKLELIKKVSTKNIYRLNNGRIKIFKKKVNIDNNVWKFKKNKKSIIVFDYGIKYSILRYLLKDNFEIIVIPFNTKIDVISAINPDGIILSSGPGDPSSLNSTIDIVKKLINKGLPIFGVCLGHQIISLAMGAKTYKLKFGHRGSNHPVINLLTGKLEITSQNHGFAVDIESIKNKDIEITHLNLNDNTIEGIRHRNFPIFSIQYHPESSPGPNDSTYLFSKFKKIIENA